MLFLPQINLFSHVQFLFMVSEATIGLLFGIGAAVVWATVYTMHEYLLKELSVWQLYFAFLLMAVIMLIPLVALGRIQVPFLFSINRTFVLVAIASALTIVAEFFILSSISKAGAGRAASVEILYPLLTILLTAVILKTKFTPIEIIGSILIVSGVALILWSSL